MRARRVRAGLLLVPLAAGLTTGCSSAAECPGVYSAYQRQVELVEAAAAEAGGAGWLEDPQEAALVARAASLHLVLDNPRCFPPGDVSRAMSRLPLVEERLADHRTEPSEGLGTPGSPQ